MGSPVFEHPTDTMMSNLLKHTRVILLVLLLTPLVAAMNGLIHTNCLRNPAIDHEVWVPSAGYRVKPLQGTGPKRVKAKKPKRKIKAKQHTKPAVPSVSPYQLKKAAQKWYTYRKSRGQHQGLKWTDFKTYCNNSLGIDLPRGKKNPYLVAFNQCVPVGCC